MKHKCLLRIQNLHTLNQVRTKRLHCSIIYIFLNILVKALCCYLLWLSNEKRKYTKNCYFAPYPGLNCLRKSQNLRRFNQDRTKRFFLQHRGDLSQHFAESVMLLPLMVYKWEVKKYQKVQFCLRSMTPLMMSSDQKWFCSKMLKIIF